MQRRLVSALCRAIQRQKGTGAPPHPPDVSLRGAKRRGNLVQAVTVLPIAFLQFSLVLRDSHVASLLGMTNLGVGAVDGNAFKFVTALGAQGAPLQTQSVRTI